MNTITENYLSEQKRLHENPMYGVASVAVAPLVAAIINQLKIKTLADYGAGKCRLRGALSMLGVSVRYAPFDPAFPEYGPAVSADLVTCIDVLEHVEPKCLGPVLLDLQRITVGFGFFTIHTGPAKKFLSDGRNAHLIQRPASWWLPRLCTYFEVLHLEQNEFVGNGFCVLVKPLVECSTKRLAAMPHG
jgi:hypothetical protein